MRLPAFSILQFDPIEHAGHARSVLTGTHAGGKCGGQWAGHLSFSHLLRHANHPAQLEWRWITLPEANTGVLNLRLDMCARGQFQRAGYSTPCVCTWPVIATSSQGLYLSLLRHLEGIELVLLDQTWQPGHGRGRV